MGKPDRTRRQLDIDFIAPHALEDCAYRLGQLDDRREIPFVPPVSVVLERLDADTWAFRLSEDAFAPVVIQGYLNRLHHESTYVSGIAIVRRHRLYRDSLIGLLVIAGLALVVGVLISLIYLPVLLYLLQRYGRTVRAELIRLVCVVGDVLTY